MYTGSDLSYLSRTGIEHHESQFLWGCAGEKDVKGLVCGYDAEEEGTQEQKGQIRLF